MPYQMQVLAKVTLNGEEEWRSIRPSGGKPYVYETREEAERMLRICYPNEVTEIRLGAKPMVRVLYVLPEEESK